MDDDVRLRDVEGPDLEVFFEQQLDPEAARLANFPSRDRERFMTHWTTRILGDPTGFVQTVTVDGQPAGHVVAWWDRDRRFVGYWLGRPFWGRGVGTRALRLFLEREQTRPLYADPSSGNPASVRLLEKCGFERAGTVRYGEAEHILLILT
jgi:RimJ/RimL family protein N-acetyltransferase